MAARRRRLARLCRETARVASATLVTASVVAGTCASAQQLTRTKGPAASRATEEREPAIAAAVALIADRFTSIPRIYVVDPALVNVRIPVAGFRIWYGDRVNPNVYVSKFSEIYRAAASGDACGLKVLAALLAHEIAHSYTKDEAEPTRAEIAVLDRFIAEPATSMREEACLSARRGAVQTHARGQNRN